ncbi:MAG: Smr domain [Mahella sp.]|nr:Smr domain [Mahella sp.]
MRCVDMPEIDLHPEFVDFEDAEYELRDFIRRCRNQRNVKKVRIIHGFGNGSMERLVRQVIEEEGYSAGDYHYDWDNWGATILHL